MFWSILGWILLVLVLLLASVLGFLLLARMRVQAQFPEGSSSFGWCRLSYSPAVFVALEGSEKDPVLRWRLLWWHSSWHCIRDPFPAAWRERFAKSNKKEEAKDSASAEGRSKPKRQRTRLTLDRMRLLGQATWQSLHVRRFYLDIDTGNWSLKGQCYPLVAWAKARGWPIAINFQGETVLIADVWVRPVHLLWAIAWAYIRPIRKHTSSPSALRWLGAVFYHP